MRVQLPRGWSIEIPSGFDHEWNEETWEAEDKSNEHNVFVTVFSTPTTTPAEELLDVLDNPSDVIEHHDGWLHGYAFVSPGEDGGYLLNAASHVPGTACICTVHYADEQDLSWALDTWRSLRNVTPMSS